MRIKKFFYCFNLDNDNLEDIKKYKNTKLWIVITRKKKEKV